VARRAGCSTGRSRSSSPDADLPPANPWTTQAFAMQSVSLASFPPGEYELEGTVRDRLTRTTASGTVAFTIGVR
jgi:hypothetical protein